MFRYKYCQIYPWFNSVLIKADLMLPPVGQLQTKTSKIRLHVSKCKQHILYPIPYLTVTTNQKRYTAFLME